MSREVESREFMSELALPAFAIYQDAIPTAQMRAALDAPECGALVVFEGWVRNHFNARAVQALEYSAYESLAVQEGRQLVRALSDRMQVRALAAHRLGHLQVGELAVWVGVAAGHRAEAFAACREIIDAIKARVPIWKREHYREGEVAWRHEAVASQT
jgi:molybdopterin synthase catalytic subunit